MNFRHYKEIKEAKGNADLLIVSKMRSIEEIMAFYNEGERLFGENRSDELVKKATILPNDIKWHFISHLQKNKVKQVIPYISCLESLDSIELAKEIEKQCIKHNKRIDALAEFHLATEDEKKTGLNKEDALSFFKECNFEHINLKGIMLMGPNTENIDRIKEVFMEGYELFSNLQRIYGKERITTLSMGMSDDYKIALECGSNEIRIGSILFKED